MSIRSVIEINHDALHNLTTEDAPRLIEWLRSLGGVTPRPGFTSVNGVRFLGQRHHSETLNLTVE